MHEYRRFVQREMDARNWNQNDVARHAGLNRQTIHAILTDTRELLTQVPSDKTIDGLAAAFTVSRETVLAHVALAMGLPVKLERADVSEVSNDELIREMARRLKAGDGRGEATPLNQAAGSAADQAGQLAADKKQLRAVPNPDLMAAYNELEQTELQRQDAEAEKAGEEDQTTNYDD